MALTTTAAVKEYLRISGSDDDTLIGNLVTRAQKAIETYTGRLFDSATYREWHNGSRDEWILLKNWPVTSVGRVAYGSATGLSVTGSTATDLRATVEVQDAGLYLLRVDSAGDEQATTLAFSTYKTTGTLATQVSATTGWTGTVGTDWPTLDLHRMAGQNALGVNVDLTYPSESGLEVRVDEDAGILQIVGAGRNGWPTWDEDGGGHFPRGFQNLLVQYTGGYSTIPEDLAQIAIDVVADLYRQTQHDQSVMSESLGDYSYTNISQQDLRDRFGSRLEQWRDRRS